MSLILHTKRFPTKQSPAKEITLLCGFGGAIWQTRRLVTTLNRAGYNVTALDFSKKVLSQGDVTLLPQLVDEVVAFVEKEVKQHGKKVLLVGISLGSLLSLNIFRRSSLFDEAIMVTGGNIVTVAQHIYGPKVWPQTHTALSDIWQDINIFTDPALLKDKRAVFVLPAKDKLIDTSEVLAEIEKQNAAGNSIRLVTRHRFSHIGTIIEETIIYPKRILGYIKQLEQSRLPKRWIVLFTF